MSFWQGINATWQFEMRRFITWQRLAISGVLALFPPLMIFFISWGTYMANSIGDVGSPVDTARVAFIIPAIIVLLVGIVAVLALLLWATTNVYSELEGKSWIFLTSRPHGRWSLFFGKYLASVAQAFAISETAFSLCVMLAPQGALEDKTQFWLAFTGVLLIGCWVYAALLSAIGSLFYRRALVVGAGYLLAIEFFGSLIPGMVCNFTISRHLRDLGIHWIGWILPQDRWAYESQFGWYPVWVNLGALLLIGSIALFVGQRIITVREYITGDET